MVSPYLTILVDGLNISMVYQNFKSFDYYYCFISLVCIMMKKKKKREKINPPSFFNNSLTPQKNYKIEIL
jgi:hypothetical protein